MNWSATAPACDVCVNMDAVKGQINQLTVYCDESRHDGAKCHDFMAIGSLWVPTAEKRNITRHLAKLCKESKFYEEIKWNKVTASRIAQYQKLLEYFFSQTELEFRVLVVEHAKWQFPKKDRELGFYALYQNLLEQTIAPSTQLTILLDFQKNSEADRYTSLKRHLERAVLGKAWINELTIIDSRESRLAQLTDLLTGAVAAAYCGTSQGGKAELIRMLADMSGTPDLGDPSVAFGPNQKFQLVAPACNLP